MSTSAGWVAAMGLDAVAWSQPCVGVSGSAVGIDQRCCE
jgi:hypothetical protein